MAEDWVGVLNALYANQAKGTVAHASRDQRTCQGLPKSCLRYRSF